MRTRAQDSDGPEGNAASNGDWAASLALPTPAALAEAFLWEARRTVTKTATVSLHGNIYQVDPVLVGRRVELVFDPFDLTTVETRLGGTPAGLAIPHRIGRHAHPKARPETPPDPPPAPTGIDYAGLIDTAHQAELAQGVNYTALTRPPTPAPTIANGVLPGQLDLFTGEEVQPTTPDGDNDPSHDRQVTS
ncbi:MAG: Mu transposase C-terminal domain-containing protein [Pseudonocardiaceae bacterium]